MNQIHCNECEKFLFETEESGGAVGAEAQIKGFVFKMPFMFTDKYDFLFFCNKDCAKAFYDKNIPKNEKSTKILNEFKDKIPEMSKEICKGLAEIQERFKKYQTK